MGVENETSQAGGGGTNNNNNNNSNNNNNAPSSSSEKEGSAGRSSSRRINNNASTRTSMTSSTHSAASDNERGLLNKLYSRPSARRRGVGAFHVIPDPSDEAFRTSAFAVTNNVEANIYNEAVQQPLPSRHLHPSFSAAERTKKERQFVDELPHATDISGEMPVATTESPNLINKDLDAVSCFERYKTCIYFCVGLLIIAGSIAMIVLNALSNRENRLNAGNGILPDDNNNNDALDPDLQDGIGEDQAAYYCHDTTGEFLLGNVEEIPRSERYKDLKVFFELQLYLKEDDLSSDGMIFQDPCGPHDLALMWMADVDEMQLLVSPTDDAAAATTSDGSNPSTTKDTAAALLQRFAVVLLSFSTKMQSTKLVTERDDLLSKPWLSKDEHECNWHGIKCRNNNFFENTISFIEIPDARLRGSIPNSITQLIPYIATLDVSNNDLTGTLPGSLYHSKRLLDLNLSMNKFSGKIDHVEWRASNLRKLKLADNKFSGTIPESFGSMEYLEELNLFMNSFSGSIPPGLFELPALKLLFLADNDLTGTLSNFGSTDLDTLDVSRNDLSGTFPESLSELTNLHSLNVADNRFSGTIPALLGSLENLNMLELSYNKFTGTIPTELVLLRKLETLRLQFNGISGTLKTEFGRMNKLLDLNFKSNSITGSVPSEMANMRSLQILSLIANYLTGNVPREFASMSNLQVLELDNNYLEGTVPTEVCQLTNDGTLFIFSADCLRKELHCPFTTCCTWCNP